MSEPGERQLDDRLRCRETPLYPDRDQAEQELSVSNRSIVEETDYCGIVSGESVDKAGLLSFFTVK